MGDEMGGAVAEKGKQQVVGESSGNESNKQLMTLNVEPPADAQDGVPVPERIYHEYPNKLAAYADVLANRDLFMDTLEKLHHMMHTKFMVPIIGGRELDLHRLFVEVTSRGGIEKVIGDRRWREVTAVFSFPSTATNASFILRKYYMSLLHHYEQIHFFGSQGYFSAPTASSHPQTTSTPSQKRIEPTTREAQGGRSKRRRNNDEFACAGPFLPTNDVMPGVITGKFDHGFLVTVKVGNQMMNGFIYPALGLPAVQSGIADNSDVKRGLNRRQRRKKLSKRDPTHPKPNRSGYNFFFAEQHARLKPHYPGKDREISKMIGDMWNKLTETDKEVYQEKAVKDKERYKSEMAAYKGKLKMGPVISNAVPLQQHPFEPELVMEDVDSKLESEGNLPSPNQNGSSSDGGSSEGKMSSEDSETETSQELGATAAESSSLVAEPSAEEDGFELRKRDNAKVNNELELPGSSEDAESGKVRDP